MIRKFTLFLFLTLFFGTVSFGQTASLETKTAFPNTNITVALNVGAFTNVNSITFNIRYNPAVLSYAGISNSIAGVTSGVTDSTIHLTWTAGTGPALNLTGLLCKLNFLYNGTTATLGFLPGCSVTTTDAPSPHYLVVGYTNGTVSPSCGTQEVTATIQTRTAVPSYPFPVPVKVSFATSLTNVGAITLKVKYDPAKLVFTGATGSTPNFSTGMNYSANNGIVTITWVNADGKAINGSEFNLSFEYNVSETVNISFAPGCVISTAAITPANVDVCYQNGSISPDPAPEDFATLGDVPGAIQGDIINVPLNLDIQNSYVYDFTLYLQFDPNVMTFIGVDPTSCPYSSEVIANASGSLLTVVFVQPGIFPPPAPDFLCVGTFVNFKFRYNGMGTTHVNFLGNSQFVDDGLYPINIGYTNSIITPGIWPPYATATISSVADAEAGTDVEVPVAVDGFTTNPLGAVTMYIGYNTDKLTFTGLTSNPHGATYSASPANGQVSIAWSDPAGATLTGEFLRMNFQYHGGGGGTCSSDIFFTNDHNTHQSCELAKLVAPLPLPDVEPIPGNWINGGINLFPSSSINGTAGPETGTSEIYSTTPAGINHTWTVDGGTITSGNTGASITVLWGPAGPGHAVDVTYNNTGGCQLTAHKDVTIISSPPTTITGYVTYFNGATNPCSVQYLDNVSINFYGSTGSMVGSTTTNSSGMYTISSVPQDYYTITATRPASAAGILSVSSIDALLAQLYTAGYPITLLPLQLKAANVNGIQPVNGTDALLIKQYIAGGGTPAFAAGDWVFDDAAFPAFSPPTSTHNIQALYTGDINGSLCPAKERSMIAVTEDGVQNISVNKSFTYDLKTANPAQIGAMTLYLGYDPALFEIENITSSQNGLVWSNKSGKVSIAWSSLTTKQLQSGDDVISFQVKALKPIAEPTRIFSLMGGSEFGDPGAQVVNDITIKLSKVITNDPSSAFSMFNYPNPFKNGTTIVYQLPATGHVRILLTDLFGRQISSLADGMEDAGIHTLAVSPSSFNLASGVYLYKIEFVTGTDTFTKINKMVYTQ